MLFATAVAWGHEAGLSSVSITQEDDALALHYRFNGEELATLSTERLSAPFETISVAGQAVSPSEFRSVADEPGQAAWRVRYRLPPGSAPVTLTAELLKDLPRGHRQLVYTGGAGNDAGLAPLAILDRTHPEVAITGPDGAGATHEAHSLAYWMLDGARHIWTGFDHLAFLGVLLLPLLVGLRRGSRTATALSVARLVTVFSVAHSITLLLAAFHVVALPDRLVESSIALSVVVAAVANLRRVSPMPGLVLAFGFGLLHGFGFAGALGDTGLAGGTLVLSLLAFNVGVELGQLAIVLAVLLVAVAPWARLGLPVEHTGWRRPAMGAGSLAIAGLGAWWLVERVAPIFGV
ncbi:MAG: HupE/UreJ family protein [Pseudomonadota bacterium]